MADIIHCTTVREQPAFNDEGADTVHVTLSFDQSASAPKAAPEGRFEAFLAALPNARFQLYEVVHADLKLNAVTRPDGSPWQRALGDPPTGLATPLMAWLKARGAAWTSPADDPSDYRVLSAQELLASTETWDAPVPQKAGLSRILQLEGVDGAKEYTILPFFSDTAPQEILDYTVSPDGSLPGGSLTVEYDAGGGFDGVTAVLSGGQLDPAPASQGKPSRRGSIGPVPDDGSLLVNGTTGFIESAKGAEQALETLKRVRERGASLLWTAPQLLDLVKSTALKASRETIADRLRWRTMTGLLSLLDPIVAALGMATREQEGPFVARLNAAIEDAADQRGIPGLADAFTKKVQEAFTNPGSADETRRQRLAVLLARAFGFEDKLVARSADVSDALFVKQLAAIPDLVPLMLSIYVAIGAGRIDPTSVPPEIGAIFGAEPRPWADDLDAQLDRELADLAESLGTEDGVESLVLNLLDALGVGPEWIVAQVGIDVAEATRAHAAFRLALKDGFNGLNAVSHAQGQMFQHFLTQSLSHSAKGSAPQGTKPDPWTYDDLTEALAEANWFARRVGLVPGGAFDRLAWLPTFPWEADEWSGAVVQKLKERYAEACAELLGANLVSRRPVPDTLPRPISIQLAVDDDTAGGDLFSQAYNGIAMLVRRDEGPWAYANLARLNGDGVDEVTIHPLQLAEVDGQRQLSFDYQGAPLASNAYQPAPEDEAIREDLAPFYRYDALAPGTFGGYAPLPALGYGDSYDVAAFVVASSGALPDTVRKDADHPWLPTEKPTVPDGAHVQGGLYLRTTALGQVSLEEANAGGAARAPFDRAIPGVMPLFRDYPRIAYAASAGRSTTFDLWRNGDGSGGLTLPSEVGASVTAEISDLWGWHGAGALTLELYDRRRIDGHKPLCNWTFAIAGPITHEQRTVTVRKAAEGWQASVTPDDETHIPGISGDLWLHATLTAGAGAPLCLSFAVPAAPDAQGTSVNRDKSGLLLLAPSDGDHFRTSEVPNSAEFRITAPRMSFQDFDRWLSSRKLFTDSMKPGKPLSLFLATLLGALAEPPTDEREEKLLLELFNRLPDLAVSGLLIEILPVDGLSQTPRDLVKDEAGKPYIDVIPLQDLETVIAGSSAPQDWLTKIKAAYSFPVRVKCEGTKLHMKDGTISVPAGKVVQLRISPLVPKALFKGGAKHVFADWMIEWAIGERDDCFVFGGPMLTIETMQPFGVPEDGDPLWPDLAESMISVMPAGIDRRYDLTVEEREPAALDWRWRQLGWIDVQTQRWRFMGRPIYRWFNPKDEEHCWGGYVAGCPIRRLKSTDGVRAFEADAFLDRDPEESDSQTAMLRPQPSVTMLQSFPWEQPSATFFRHRLVLRSRYAGAIARAKEREVEITRSRDGIDWWRVAMLADRSRLQLTRPQLRALMPLSVSPEATGTPPVLAMLEEHPFAYGGLADRIGAEVKTGFGYELLEGGTLKLLDSRKEIGPDPRLSYHPMAADNAHAAMLNVEGPIGLTFDSASAPAPFYANSALLLSPKLLRVKPEQEGFDEHFLSVSLRRYLAREWTVGDEQCLNLSELSAAEPWWIEFYTSATISCADKAGASVSICEIVRGDDWTVRVPRAAIMSGDTGEPIKVATASLESGSRMCLLHQPLEEGRGAISLFLAGGSARTSDGEPAPSAPVMLASYEWAFPALPAPKVRLPPPRPVADRIVIEGEGKAWPAAASPATSMNWTRTGANADLLHFHTAYGKPLKKAKVADLALIPSATEGKAHLVRTGSSDPLWALPMLSAYPNPLYVHRHLAAIYTSETRHLGRNETYVEALMLCGAELPAPRMAYDKVRIVEIETPALPIASATQVPGFDTACFDVVALSGAGEERSTNRKCLMFCFRPVTRLRLGPGTSFTLSVRCTLEDRSATTQTLSMSLKEAKDVHSILLWLSSSSAPLAAAVDGAGVVGLLVAEVSGQSEPQAIELSTTVELTGLTVDQGAPQSEFWADVSMLLVNKKPEAVDRMRLPFEALFTGDTASAAEAVSPSRLRNQAEAGARILSCSEPIPVSRGTS